MQYSDIDKEINKLAQRFGLGGSIRESINLGGNWLEMTNSDFKSIMNDLRETDSRIRDLVTGKNTSHDSLKNILKNVEKNLNRREYVAALSEVVKFYDIVIEAAEELKSLDPDFLKSHYRTLSSELSSDQINSLFSLKQKPTLASHHQSKIVKQAGILDFLHNIFSSRARGLRSWEKRFPRSANKLRSSIASLFKISISINNSIISSLKKMKEFRIGRKVEDYLEEKKALLSRIDSYKGQFKSSYNSDVKQIVKDIEETLTGGVSEKSSALPEPKKSVIDEDGEALPVSAVTPPPLPQSRNVTPPPLPATPPPLPTAQPAGAPRAVTPPPLPTAQPAATGTPRAATPPPLPNARRLDPNGIANQVATSVTQQIATSTNLSVGACRALQTNICANLPVVLTTIFDTSGLNSSSPQELSQVVNLICEITLDAAKSVMTNDASLSIDDFEDVLVSEELSSDISSKLNEILVTNEEISGRATEGVDVESPEEPVAEPKVESDRNVTQPSLGQEGSKEIEVRDISSLDAKRSASILKEELSKLPLSLSDAQQSYLINLYQNVEQVLSDEDLSEFAGLFGSIIDNSHEASVVDQVHRMSDLMDRLDYSSRERDVPGSVRSERLYAEPDQSGKVVELEDDEAITRLDNNLGEPKSITEEPVLEDDIDDDFSYADRLDRALESEDDRRDILRDRELDLERYNKNLDILDKERDSEKIEKNLMQMRELIQSYPVAGDISQQKIQELSYLKDNLPIFAGTVLEKHEQDLTPEQKVEVKSVQDPVQQLATIQKIVDDNKSRSYQERLNLSYNHKFTQEDIDIYNKNKPESHRRYDFDFNLILSRSLEDIINESLDYIFSLLESPRNVNVKQVNRFGKQIQAAIELILNSNVEVYYSSEEIKLLILKLFQIKLKQYLDNKKINQLSEDARVRLTNLYQAVFTVGDRIYTNINGAVRRQGEIEVGKDIVISNDAQVLPISSEYLEDDDLQPNISSSSTQSAVTVPSSTVSTNPAQVPPATAPTIAPQASDPLDLTLDDFSSVGEEDSIAKELDSILSPESKKKDESRSRVVSPPPKNPLPPRTPSPSSGSKGDSDEDFFNSIGRRKPAKKAERKGGIGTVDSIVNIDYDTNNPGELDKLISKVGIEPDLAASAAKVADLFSKAKLKIESETRNYENLGKDIESIEDCLRRIENRIGDLSEINAMRPDAQSSILEELQGLFLELKAEIR